MVDAEERMKGVAPEYLLEKCQEFLTGKWRLIGVPQFDFKVLSVGFGNRLFVCKIKDDDSVPAVLIRLYGGNVLPRDAPIRTLNEVTETLLFYKLGELNYGPKLLGSFDGGRLEEFVLSSTMVHHEYCTNQNVARALAVRMAQYHRIDVPLKKKPWDVVNIAKTCYKKFQDAHPELASNYLNKGGDVGRFERMRALIEFDVIEFADWIAKVMKKIETRIVFTHNDANRSNIMIKGASQNLNDKDLVDRMLLIDCEFSGYSHRGQDIGNAFCMRMFDFAGEKFVSGYGYPDENDRRLFIEAYVEDMRKSNHYDDWDEKGIDSVEHILMESEFGAIYCRLINVVWCLRDIEMWNALREKMELKDPQGSMGAFPDFVTERRKLFVEKYPQFA